MKRIMHSYETKMKAIELKIKGYSNSQVRKELGLKNNSQVQTWWTWYRNGETYRFKQPVGKQYSYGKGPEGSTPEETMKLRIQSLEQQIELLKKYKEMERKWFQK